MTTTPLIEVTDMASQKLEEILNEQGETGALLRMMVVPGPNGSSSTCSAWNEKRRLTTL